MAHSQIIDADRKEINREIIRQEIAKEQFTNWANLQAENSEYLDGTIADPTNALARLGRPLTATQLEGKLKKLNPALEFIWEYGAIRVPRRVVCVVEQGIRKELFPFEAGLMPERSVMVPVRKEIPDATHFSRSAGVLAHLNRRDAPKSEFVPGTGLVWDTRDNTPFGFKQVTIPWSEKIRGWRTVVLRLIILGLLQPASVARTFGDDYTPEWAAGLGKRDIKRPW